ncbi:glycosyltransferase family 2 protein [Hespellia stercorisuis]|uniref:Glycosyl transferase family 2 n=1 Tax=Hespellia stercorisuis DSM 15480 TaxID=1121950 RepID=A0A1M6JXE0_9FIRM|nr:glycosyltransferase family 2 protein [Hespellia stercorisuis]SHJ51350.1 Glycosyl transferase family 2 [Hespellia stercorisuis DSM 15480]
MKQQIKSEQRPYFSIVMPTYGVENYIRKAIDSILAQTFTAWEVIVVDDCTPDDSAKIAQEYADKDARIRVLHHEKNKGLSPARNTGAAAASGEYIWFMDPDDYVDDSLLQEVYKSLQKNRAQIVVFGLIEEYYDKKGNLSYSHKVAPQEAYYKTAEGLRKNVIYLEQETLYGYAWNKFYDLSYMRTLNLQYENVKLIEDIVFNVKFCTDIERMNLLPITPYHYAKRMEANLTNKFVPDYYALHKRRIDIIFDQYNYWNMDTQEVRSILGSLYGRYIVSALVRNCDKRSGMHNKERYKWCREVFASSLFNELIPCAKSSGSVSLAVALFCLKWKKAMFCLALGRFVYIAREALPMVYSKVKSGR